MTIIHIFQTQPKLLISDSVVQLFKREMEKGNLKPIWITDALDFYTQFSTPCKEDELAVNTALRAWGIAPLDSNIFADCKN